MKKLLLGAMAISTLGMAANFPGKVETTISVDEALRKHAIPSVKHVTELEVNTDYGVGLFGKAEYANLFKFNKDETKLGLKAKLNDFGAIKLHGTLNKEFGIAYHFDRQVVPKVTYYNDLSFSLDFKDKAELISKYNALKDERDKELAKHTTESDEDVKAKVEIQDKFSVDSNKLLEGKSLNEAMKSKKAEAVFGVVYKKDGYMADTKLSYNFGYDKQDDYMVMSHKPAISVENDYKIGKTGLALTNLTKVEYENLTVKDGMNQTILHKGKVNENLGLNYSKTIGKFEVKPELMLENEYNVEFNKEDLAHSHKYMLGVNPSLTGRYEVINGLNLTAKAKVENNFSLVQNFVGKDKVGADAMIKYTGSTFKGTAGLSYTW